MAKKKQEIVPVTSEGENSYDKEKLLKECQQHYRWWNDDNEIRATRKNGWNDITDAYYGILPQDWPFTSRTTDPRIRTTLLEKNARLTNKRIRGKVIPREGGDIVKARVNNALLDFQWDTANFGGSMQTKLSICDMDARLYQSKFAYIPWKIIKGEKDEICFEGNEFIPKNIRDCGMDPNCDHIRSAQWFQMREWDLLENIEKNKDLYEGYAELTKKISIEKGKSAQNRRDTAWQDRLKGHQGIEDRMGTDPAFPVIEKVTEFRKNQWIIFCPRYNVILTVMDNPYDHGKIPVSQLRYYPTDGDNLGESEVESVIPLWKAIQAVLCSMMDESISKMRPPLKIVEGSVRIETIVREPDAQWIVDNPNAITEMETRGDSVRYFQTIYPTLVSAFNVAMGDLSQGTSNIDPMGGDKTATEIRQVSKQQNSRDQKNQQELADFVKDFVSMWQSNNKQFLFKDQSKHEYVLRIIGEQMYESFKRIGMDEMVLTAEGSQAVQRLIDKTAETGEPMDQATLKMIMESVKVPKYPVIENPEEEDDNKLIIKPKLRMGVFGDSAELSVVPDDLEGSYDFIPDMKSMDTSAGEQAVIARSQALSQMSNPNMLQLLQLQGWKPLIKDVLVANFEDWGLNDAGRFFEQINQNGASQPGILGQPQGGFSPTGGALPNQQAQGMGNVPQAPTQASTDQQLARPQGM